MSTSVGRSTLNQSCPFNDHCVTLGGALCEIIHYASVKLTDLLSTFVWYGYINNSKWFHMTYLPTFFIIFTYQWSKRGWHCKLEQNKTTTKHKSAYSVSIMASQNIPWICYERSYSEFYLSIWNQLVFNQRLQMFVQSPQPYLLIFAWRN